jgi:hypothetical protein
MLDAEQFHVSVAGESVMVVSWASFLDQVANLTIEKTDRVGMRPLGRRTIKPTQHVYRLKCGLRYNRACRWNGTYSSPSLLHARVAVTPSARYRYRVSFAGQRGRWRSFRAPPAIGAGQEMRLAIVGDLGQTEFSRETCAGIARAYAAGRIDVAVMLGDLAYADTDARRWDSFARQFDEAGCSHVPWLVMPGNHEIEPDELTGEAFIPYRKRWRTPQIEPEFVGQGAAVYDWHTLEVGVWYDYGGSFYSLRLGGAHIIVLNPYTSTHRSSSQIQWLRGEMKRINRTITPRILIFTHAPFRHTSMAHETSVELATLSLRNAVEQMFIDAEVDMVFSGHVHAYERMHPIDGITHFVVGHGGNYEKLYDEWHKSDCSAFR